MTERAYTATELHEIMEKMRQRLGPRAETALLVMGGEVHIHLRPHGMLEKPVTYITASNIETAILRAWVAAHEYAEAMERENEAAAKAFATIGMEAA